VAAVLIQIFWKFVKNVVLMFSGSSAKIGHVWSKTRSQELKIEFFFNTLVAAVLIQISWKLVRKVVLMISRSSLNMGCVQSKIRSHCPNMEKSLQHTIGHMFDSVASNLVMMLV
jgi:hypothetical protein